LHILCAARVSFEPYQILVCNLFNNSNLDKCITAVSKLTQTLDVRWPMSDESCVPLKHTFAIRKILISTNDPIITAFSVRSEDALQRLTVSHTQVPALERKRVDTHHGLLRTLHT